jgi:hypothetical protein
MFSRGSDCRDLLHGFLRLFAFESEPPAIFNRERLTSSAAAANSQHLTALGIIQSNQHGTPVFGSLFNDQAASLSPSAEAAPATAQIAAVPAAAPEPASTALVTAGPTFYAMRTRRKN